MRAMLKVHSDERRPLGLLPFGEHERMIGYEC
jgi:hypothetical protein